MKKMEKKRIKSGVTAAREVIERLGGDAFELVKKKN